MFDRFTDGARRVVVWAQEEALRLNHPSIGSEHMLLSLLRDPDETAGQALTDAGLTLDEARRRVEDVAGRGKKPPESHIPFSPTAKQAIESAAREALALKHSHIGTEHLLLGLLAQHDGIGVQILREVVGDIDTFRQQVIDLVR